MILILDTETTGLPTDWNAPYTDVDNWPRIVQIAYQLFESNGKKIKEANYIISPDNFTIPEESTHIHNISNEVAIQEGVKIQDVLTLLEEVIDKSKYVVAHNLNFDENVLAAEYYRFKKSNPLKGKSTICTMLDNTSFCNIKNHRGLKWPKLSELHSKLFNTEFEEVHDASIDVEITSKCFWELIRLKINDYPGITYRHDPLEFKFCRKLFIDAYFQDLKNLPEEKANEIALSCFETANHELLRAGIMYSNGKELEITQDSSNMTKIVKEYFQEVKDSIGNEEERVIVNEINWLILMKEDEIKENFFINFNNENEKQIFIKFRKSLKTVLDLIQTKHLRDKNRAVIEDTTRQLLERQRTLEKESKEGCYIATMAYGDYDHPSVKILRKYRDEKLSIDTFGRIFIRFYYKFSPIFVKYVGKRFGLQKLVRKILDFFIVKFLQ